MTTKYIDINLNSRSPKRVTFNSNDDAVIAVKCEANGKAVDYKIYSPYVKTLALAPAKSSGGYDYYDIRISEGVYDVKVAGLLVSTITVKRIKCNEAETVSTKEFSGTYDDGTEFDFEVITR